MTDTSTVTDELAELQSKKKQRFEIVAAVLLGLATVAIAWGSYQANLWGGLQDKALTESARLSTDAASEYGEAGAIISLDQTLFVEVVLQLNQPGADEDAALDTVDFITTNMSAEGEAAVNEWFDNDLDFPFTEAYYQSFYAAGDETIEASDAKFEEGAKNNTTGDKYVLVSTILASVLFFAGISTVLQTDRVKRVLLGGGALLWIAAAMYIATLPIATL
ncbi:hypothetical protein [Ilumatobacter sp.]|uniref:hypothetical protein n=1 Tax=Ilumatobacter sp. TaxID=1967498 RepID=UPI003753DA64